MLGLGQYAMIDSTIVRAHQHSAGAQKKTARNFLAAVQLVASVVWLN